MPAPERSDGPGAPTPPTDASPKAPGVGAGGAVPAQVPLLKTPGLPSDFNRGRPRPRQARLPPAGASLGPFAALAGAPLGALGALVGPHSPGSRWLFPR